MKILAFSDLHGSKAALKRLLDKAEGVDALVCAGDFTQFGEGATKVMTGLQRVKRPVFAIHGNHEVPAFIQDLAKKFPFLRPIHKRVQVFQGVAFFGFGGGGFAKVEPELERILKVFKRPKGPLVFVTHAPPFGTRLDSLPGGHRGCQSSRAFIERFKPVLAISGHFHETASRRDAVGGTILINPGPEGKILRI